MPANESVTLRLTLLTVLLVGLFVAMFSRLWFLQVLAGERYAELAESNRVRFVVLEAPRGRILAADGTELVKNRPAQTVSADPAELLDSRGEPKDEEAEAVLGRLSLLLEMTQDEIVQQLLSRRYSPFRPVPIKEDVPPEVVFAINEQQELFRGVVGETLPVRTYPHEALAAHVVGYLGEIGEDELARPEFADYRPGDLIGWSGLERAYQHDLHGVEGLRKLEVNARGTVLRVLGEREPVRGNDLVTTLDLELQASVERILEDGIVASRDIRRQDGRYLPSVAGAAVVLDPRDGAVRALASWPSFDPAEFVGGVGQDYWAWLHDRGNEFPLLNRAIQSAYPPGSTFKIVSGAAAFAAGHVGPHTTVACAPAFQLGNVTFRNWNPRHEGRLDIADALKRSCDTYFYEVATLQWQREEQQRRSGEEIDELLPRVASTFGMGRTVGIDLPSERAGVIPSRAWREEYWEQHRDVYCRKAEELTAGTWAQRINQDLCVDGGRWRGGDAVNSSIGQGDVLTTPLQVASAYAAIANDGVLMQPRLGDRLVRPDGTPERPIEPGVVAELPLDEAALAAIQRGLERVVMDPRGTAWLPFQGFPLAEIPVAGKTGTAELRPRVPYAWFAAYAPADDPQYVVVVAVEQGGGGSQTAAPIVRRILEAAFGLEETPFRPGPANVD